MERSFFNLLQEFSLLGSFYSSQGAVKTRAIRPRLRIWVASTAAERWRSDWSTARHRLLLGWRSCQRKSSVKISLGEQRAYFYKGGVLVGVSQLSTGREGLNTPAGNYKIIQKDKDHVSSLFGDYVDSSGKVVVPNIEVKRTRNRRAHTSKAHPCPTSCASCRGRACAGYLPGYPASHGCIRMPEFMAEDFFRSVSVGTPVTITN